MATEPTYDEKLKHAADNLVKLGLAPRGTFANPAMPNTLDKEELQSVLKDVRQEMVRQKAIAPDAKIDAVFTALDTTVAKKTVAAPAAQPPKETAQSPAPAAKESVAKPQATAPAAPAKAAPPKPTIPFKGEDLVMQAQLRMLGQQDVGNLDGQKGTNTNTAMAAFAKKNGLDGADEKAVRAKIAEQYTALKMTPDKINGLISSTNPNDVKAGQVAYNLQNPQSMIKVTGVKDEATSSALVAMARGAADTAVAAKTAPAAPQQDAANPATPVTPVPQSTSGQPTPPAPMTAQPPAGAQLQPYPQPAGPEAPQVGQGGALAPAFTGQAAGGVIVRDQATGIAYNPYTGQYMNPNTGHAINPTDRNGDGKIDPREYTSAVNADNLRTNGTYVTGGNVRGMQPVLSPWTNGYPSVQERAYARQDGMMTQRQVQMGYNDLSRGVSAVMDRNRNNDGQGIGALVGGALKIFDPFGQQSPRPPRF